MVVTDGILVAPLESPVIRLLLAAALGLFLGLEREWSKKPAGIRTFSLISLLGAIFVTLESQLLLVVGGLLIIVQGVAITYREYREAGELLVTTSVSMLVAYGIGALVAAGFVLEGVVVSVLATFLLVLKRELHTFAWGLTKEELRAAIEFAVLAFVIYPLLPEGTVTLDLYVAAVDFEPRVAWLMVVTLAAVGIINYAIVETYGGRGLAITGFFGGFAISTAVVGSMVDYVRRHPDAASYAGAAVMLAVAAMAIRNLGIAIIFTLSHEPLVVLVGPLLAVAGVAIALAYGLADWSAVVDFDIESPFSIRYVLGFGGVFIVVLIAGGLAEVYLGEFGFLAAVAVTSLISSGGATTSAVVLYRAGGVDAGLATVAVLLATGASIVVKSGISYFGPSEEFAHRVILRSGVLLAVLLLAVVIVYW